MRTIHGIAIDDFTFSYITAALWSSLDWAQDDGGDPLDANYGPDDIHPETLRRMVEDCQQFRALDWTHTDALGRCSHHSVQGWLDSIDRPQRGREYSSNARDGQDFWLTRNGHGAGFWDRGYGEIGDSLTDAANSLGEVDLYVGDDGMIHDD